MIKVSDYITNFVESLGVKHIFMLPGGGSMHLVDSVGKNKNLEPVCFLHEQALAIAADAYSQYTNNIGVALLTTGPGGTNAITGVTASFIDSIPVFVLSGQVKSADLMGDKGVRQMGVQEVDIVSLVKPITKYAVTVLEPTSIRYHLEKALYLATHGRKGPVWIDLPLDVQGSMIDETTLKGFTPPASSESATTISLQAKETIRMINEAKRPVILAGNGIRLSNSLGKFVELIDVLNIPVLTTWKAADMLPEDHPLFAGRPGAIGQRGANFAQQNADLIITLGARLDLVQIGYNHENFAPRAKRVIVDVDQTEINKLKMKIDLPVLANAGAFIEELAANVKSLLPCDRKAWLTRCQDWKKRYPVVLEDYSKVSSPVNTYVLVDALSELLGSDGVLSSGGCAEVTLQAFKVKKGQRVFNNPGLGSMGFGLPASIGAAIASQKNTVTLIGDGGLQHNIQELQTVARLNLTQRNMFKGNFVCCDSKSGLTLPHLEKLCSAYGISYTKIENHEELKGKLSEVLGAKNSVICEVFVDPNLLTAPRLSSEIKPDGSIVSKPMEDLFPFLDREELKENMSF